MTLGAEKSWSRKDKREDSTKLALLLKQKTHLLYEKGFIVLEGE